jgi:glucose-6-phosphate-specific signal transduction histidine kinase
MFDPVAYFKHRTVHSPTHRTHTLTHTSYCFLVHILLSLLLLTEFLSFFFFILFLHQLFFRSYHFAVADGVSEFGRRNFASGLRRHSTLR